MDMTEAFTITELAGENIFNVVVNGVSASIAIPEEIIRVIHLHWLLKAASMQ